MPVLEIWIEHPLKKYFERAYRDLHGRADEETKEYMGYLEEETDRIPEISAEVEILNNLVSVYIAEGSYLEAANNLNKIIKSSSQKEEVVMKQWYQLEEALGELYVKEDIITRVFQFDRKSGYIIRIEKYDGDFNEAGWRWHRDARIFSSDESGMKKSKELAQRGYRTAHRIQKALKDELADPNMRVKEWQDKNTFLQAFANITKPGTEQKFLDDICS